MAQRPSDDANRAFESLYRTHRDVVYRAALRDLRDAHAAEDVTQAAFVDAYRAVLRGSRPQAPRAWLLAIATNVRNRSFRQALARPREVPLDEGASADAPPPSASASQLKTALQGLPRPQLEAFVLREISGLSYEEIAERTGTTVPAVQMALFRARQTLRAALERPAAARRARVLLPASWLSQLLARGEAMLPGARGVAAAAGAAVVAVGAVAVGGADADPRRERAAPSPTPVVAPAVAGAERTPAAAAAPTPTSAPASPVTAAAKRAPAPPEPVRPRPASPPAAAAPATPPAPAAAAPPREVAEPVRTAETIVETTVETVDAVELVEAVVPAVEQLLEDAVGAAGAPGGSTPPPLLPPLPLDAPPPVVPPVPPLVPEPRGGIAPPLPSAS